MERSVTMASGARRLALVTGANRGIGLAIARGLAARGLTVILGGRDTEKARRAADPLRAEGLSAIPVQLDVTDQASVDADLRVVQAALETNLIGAWRLCIAALPLMRRHGYGRIVNVSSSSGAFSEPGFEAPAYSVSKAGLNMLTLRLAAELAGSGILVNACCPGWVRTEMGGPNAPLSPEQGADTAI